MKKTILILAILTTVTVFAVGGDGTGKYTQVCINVGGDGTGVSKIGGDGTEVSKIGGDGTESKVGGEGTEDKTYCQIIPVK